MACALGTLVDKDKFLLYEFTEILRGRQIRIIEKKMRIRLCGLEKLDEEKLPSKDEFYSRLSNTEISNKDYQHAQNL